MRRGSLLLLVVAVHAACATSATGDTIVGPWLRLEHGDPAHVSEQLAIDLGHHESVRSETACHSPRPELDAVNRAVRWRGTAADVERAESVVRRLDVARELDPRDSLREVSAYVVWPGAKQAALARDLDKEFYAYWYFADEHGCKAMPVFRCAPDPSLGVMHVRGDALSMSQLCEWLRTER